MKIKIYAIYDSKAEAYAQPFYMQSNAAALRAFTDLTLDEKTQVSAHPSDYSLYEIGEYNEETASLTGLDPVRHLGNAHELQAQAINKINSDRAALEAARNATKALENSATADHNHA